MQNKDSNRKIFQDGLKKKRQQNQTTRSTQIRKTSILIKFSLFWKIILFSTFIGVFISIGLKYFLIRKIIEKKNLIDEMIDIITKEKQIFHPLYSYFVNQSFPIISETTEEINPSTYQNYYKKILNIAYPDNNISYNVAAFSRESNVRIEYDIPSSQDIYFFSLTVYLSNGKVYKSINDSVTGFDTSHTFSISPEIVTTKTEIMETFIPAPNQNSKTYCVIIRIYKKDINYNVPSPKLVVDGEEKKYTSISEEKRESDSLRLEKLLYVLFNFKFSKKDIEIFFGVNVYQFFLPAKDLMSLVFPNEYATYLMVFPQMVNDNHAVITVKGKLQQNIGSSNKNCRYVSFMASNFFTTSTDSSINFTEIKTNEDHDYVLFVTFDETMAESKGYDKTNTNHNLLLWDEKTNEKPVLIYRIVSVATSTEHKDEDMIFTLPNQNQSIGNTATELTEWTYYPRVV